MTKQDKKRLYDYSSAGRESLNNDFMRPQRAATSQQVSKITLAAGALFTGKVTRH